MAVFKGEELIKNGEKNSDVILYTMKDIINSEPLAKIDYVQLVNADQH